MVSVLERCPFYGMYVLKGFTVLSILSTRENMNRNTFKVIVGVNNASGAISMQVG